MSTLVKDMDLVPDVYGMVSKQHTIDAMLLAGISEKAARETADANFDHLLVKQINVYRMNSLKASSPDPAGALEHFRSTGIRDGLEPHAQKYASYEACSAFDGKADEFSSRDIEECANLVWDHENYNGFAPNLDSLPAMLESNDVLESKRPLICPPTASGLSGCDPKCAAESCPRDVAPCCRSQLHGSINFLHQELGTPTGPDAVMSVGDSRNVWFHSDWPPGFEARSPRHCANASDLTVAGCEACRALIPTDAYGGLVIAATSSEAQRLCRCLLARRPHLGTHVLRALPEYNRYGCPELPVVDANITIVNETDATEGRRLQQRVSVTPAVVRQQIRSFYERKGIRYDAADVLVALRRPPAPSGTFSVKLTTNRGQAVYLAYVMSVDFQGFTSSFDVRVGTITVSIDGLNCQAAQSCEAGGSFLGGSLRVQTHTQPVGQNASQSACSTPCLQAACGSLITLTTCSLLRENGCDCEECCQSDQSPPPPPLPPPSPPPDPCLKTCVRLGRPVACAEISQLWTCNEMRTFDCDCEGCCHDASLDPSPPPLPLPSPPQPALPTVECGSGTWLNEATGRCEVASDGCSPGTTLNEATGRCEVASDGCSPGTTLNEANGRCEVARDACRDVCSAGTILNEGLGRCELALDPSVACPAEPLRCSCRMQWQLGCDEPVGAAVECEA